MHNASFISYGWCEMTGTTASSTSSPTAGRLWRLVRPFRGRAWKVALHFHKEPGNAVVAVHRFAEFKEAWACVQYWTGRGEMVSLVAPDDADVDELRALQGPLIFLRGSKTENNCL